MQHSSKQMQMATEMTQVSEDAHCSSGTSPHPDDPGLVTMGARLPHPCTGQHAGISLQAKGPSAQLVSLQGAEAARSPTHQTPEPLPCISDLLPAGSQHQGG